jgi:hypothetical protein
VSLCCSWQRGQRTLLVSTISVVTAALALCFIAGFFLAELLLWSRTGETSPLAKICARVDYANSLEENLKGQASDELRSELKVLAEQCRTALREKK